MPKCKYREINPLNDTYICTKVITNISLPEAKHATCTWQDPWLCPAAEFEDYEDERTDYDWSYYLCDPEFKQALYDIYENRGKENS